MNYYLITFKNTDIALDHSDAQGMARYNQNLATEKYFILRFQWNKRKRDLPNTVTVSVSRYFNH